MIVDTTIRDKEYQIVRRMLDYLRENSYPTLGKNIYDDRWCLYVSPPDTKGDFAGVPQEIFEISVFCRLEIDLVYTAHFTIWGIMDPKRFMRHMGRSFLKKQECYPLNDISSSIIEKMLLDPNRSIMR